MKNSVDEFFYSPTLFIVEPKYHFVSNFFILNNNSVDDFYFTNTIYCRTFYCKSLFNIDNKLSIYR